MAEAVGDGSLPDSIEVAPADIVSDIPSGQADVSKAGQLPSRMESPPSQAAVPEAGATGHTSAPTSVAEETLSRRASTVSADRTPSITPGAGMNGAVQPPQAVPFPAPQPMSAPAASTATAPLNGVSQHPPASQPPEGTWRMTPTASSASQPPMHQFKASAPAPMATQQYAAARSLPTQSVHTPPPPRIQAEPMVRHKMTSNGKLFIGEPPSKRVKASGPGFRSPDGHGEQAGYDSGFNDEVNRLTSVMAATSPAAVRRVVRDSWQRTLLGSDFHQAFIMNASIHHSIPSITKRAIRDFGGRMVNECKEEIVKHLTTQSLDEVSDLILNIASEDFLDRCLAARLQTIEATPLINALAKAERLGFESGDIVDQGQPHEQVIPQQQYPTQYAAASNGTQSSQPGGGEWTPNRRGKEQVPIPDGALRCPQCGRGFQEPATYQYHIWKKVCSKEAPAQGFLHTCPKCGQGFQSPGGLHYHTVSSVCGPMLPPPEPARPNHAPVGRPASKVMGLPATIEQGNTPPLPPPPPQITATPPQTLASNYLAPSSAPMSGERDPRHALIVTEATGPYEHLKPDELASLNAELLEAERSYAQRFRDADAMPDPVERQQRWDGLRNSFGTKQSNIRKKYGVKLRERRTKAEIDAEKRRMGLGGSRVTANTGMTPSRLPTTPVTVVSQPLPRMHPPSAAQQTPVPVPAKYAAARSSSLGSSWTAANLHSSGKHGAPSPDDAQDAKRQRMDANGAYSAPSQVQTSSDDAYAQDQASAESLAMAAIRNVKSTLAPNAPTSRPPEVYEQSGARIEIHHPTSESGSHGTAPVNDSQHEAEDPTNIVIDDDATDSSDSSDDEDIPAVLPAHVKQSLSTTTRVAV